ncbi:hypothetical protein O0I10_007046 [Lichtheimia ornata]|uniref:Uncharacterized protein n=1 Tax=Lichtheimia ornata TaxID=688661 RepID=A0AAD7XWM8_9FUNG|nr:uncharacterized protein O0I10_007046 [Lichtheimia ornata]KAJ8657230.1 hypothetical protein O0I10_007046 [Lichtheimia ornata]
MDQHNPKAILEQAVDQLQHAPPSTQKVELAEMANKLHQSVAGGAEMQFDKDDNPVMTGKQANECPFLQEKQHHQQQQ